MIEPLFVGALGASLLGSLHCGAMCGPLVACDAACQGKHHVASQASYQAGRLVTYLLLGTLAGFIGRAADLVGTAAGIGRVAAVFAGVWLGLFGVVLLLRTRGIEILPGGMRNFASERTRTLLVRLLKRPPLFRSALIGLGSGLLPCGWLYSFVLLAAGTASPPWGALVMAGLWLGSLPVLVIVSGVVKKLSLPLRRELPVLSAIVLIALGAVTVVRRTSLPTELLSATPAALESGSGTGRATPSCH